MSTNFCHYQNYPHSCDTTRPSPSGTSFDANPSITTTSTTGIPRPVARRQMSSPAAPTANGTQRMLINLSAATAEMCAGPRSCTNPFLNGSVTSGAASAAPTLPLAIESAAEIAAPLQSPAASPPPNLFDFTQPYADTEPTAAAHLRRSRESVRSWLIDETAKNRHNHHSHRPATGNSNPFMPAGQCASAGASIENLSEPIASKRRQSHRFDDNFADAPLSPGTQSAPPLKFRSRSRSAAELDEPHPTLRRKLSATDVYLTQSRSPAVSSSSPRILTVTNPFKTVADDGGGGVSGFDGVGGQRGLHKTLSETYLLEQWRSLGTAAGGNYRSASQQWQFGKTLLQRQCTSNLSLAKSLMGGSGGGGGASWTTVASNNSGYSSGGSQSSLASSGNTEPTMMTRAQSCESVSSESSVRLDDLVQPRPLVTGQLCVGLQTDRCTQTADGIELTVTVVEAKELMPASASQHQHQLFDTFVRVYLVPDEREASQTRLCRQSATPTYNETFAFWLSGQRQRRSLWFHVYQQQQPTVK